jgi:hypothetical protein
MKKIILGFAVIFTLILQSSGIELSERAVAAIVYSGSIDAADLNRLVQQLRYDLNIPSSRATYSFDTIAVSGYYRLATNVSNQITISASNVTLDMNGCTVSDGTNGIVINSGLSNVTIKNGTVTGATSDGIVINGGCSDITFDTVTVKNAVRGFNFSNVTNSVMRNCDMISNTTGVQITGGRNIVLENCTAQANKNAGYDLISSTTCALFGCKALSTGQSNTTLFNNLVTGFVSSNGNGNIFERCIANSTQALTTTDSSSLVAGFALRGSEMCSSIINCEASEGMTSPNGFTVPYGILLEGSLSSISSVTGWQVDGRTNNNIEALDWSPDGQYLAVAGVIGTTSGNDLWVYSFDRITGLLTAVTSVAVDQAVSGIVIEAVNWSPDGQYLAIGLSNGVVARNDVWVYSFNKTAGTLAVVTSVAVDVSTISNVIRSVNWSFDGKYLAVYGDINGSTGNDLWVYRFNKTLQSLTVVTSSSVANGLGRSAVWSPDGLYLAVGGAVSAGANDLWIFSFNRSSGSLSTVTSVAVDGATNVTVFSIDWSPDGNYLAIGTRASGTTGNDLWIYRFNRSAGSLTAVTSLAVSGSTTADVQSVNWSADGNYLAVGGVVNTSTGADFWIYRFNRSLGSLTAVASASIGGSNNSDIRTVKWSPDGQYVALGGEVVGTSEDLWIYTGIQFPTKNVIMNNTTYCNSGAQFPNGVGISGSSIANMIIQNSSFNNPIYQSANRPIVYSDYQFVCNVFNQLFGDTPTLLQNLNVDYNIPVQNRIDLPAELQRLELLAFSLFDNLL